MNIADSNTNLGRESFRRFSRLAVAVPAFTFLLIALGGLVRTSGAGLACPDWPLCHGQWLPQLHYLDLIEWTHRLVAGMLGVLILAQAVWSWLVPPLRQRLGLLAGLALALYLSQAVLGGLTVLKLLSPAIVSLHLADGLALLAVVLVIALRAIREGGGGPAEAGEGSPSLFRLALVTALLIYGQSILGGGVSSNGAGLACPDFPTCHGLWLPPLTGLVGLQVAHRIGALVAFVFVMWLHVAAIRGPRQAKLASRLAATLMVIQVFLGIGDIHARLSVALSTAHLATAAALFASVVITAYAARPRPRESSVPTWKEAHAA